MLRRYDSATRYVTQIIYYFTVLVGVFQEKYGYIVVGVTLINSLPLLDQVKLSFMAKLEQRYSTSIKIRPHITFPLVLLLVTIYNKQA